MPAADVTPDFLAIGHLTEDLTPAGVRLGGAVAYAAATAARLGRRAAIVSCGRPDLDHGALGEVPVHLVESPETTRYENVYEPAGRRQWLRARAAPIEPAAVPPAWRSAAIVLIAPVAAEIAGSPNAWPRGEIRGIGLQGTLRGWDAAGRVGYRDWADPDGWLGAVDVAFVSEEDLGGAPAAEARLAAQAPCLVVTRGEYGCSIRCGDRVWDVPGSPARVVDPTGAGDVFAAAFLIRLAETGDPVAAARFANLAAAISIAGAGLTAIPDRAAIARRLSGPR